VSLRRGIVVASSTKNVLFVVPRVLSTSLKWFRPQKINKKLRTVR
jgi:hypothetical protein